MGSIVNPEFLHFEGIIFDFGGVLLDLDYDATAAAFEVLSGKPFGGFSREVQEDLFCDHECGRINNDAFRKGIRSRLQLSEAVSDKAIDLAWNAMLGGLPEKKLFFLKELSTEKSCYLLSNTNAIHQRCFEETIERQHGWALFKRQFEKVLYSHEIGMRKPDIGTFTKVAEMLNVDPSKTLFIDDSPQHVEGAKAAGFAGVFLDLKSGENLFDDSFSKKLQFWKTRL